MNATMDDLLIIIGRQAVQIALLEAELELRGRAVEEVERDTLTQEEIDEIKRVFDEGR